MLQLPEQLLTRIKRVIKLRAERGEQGWEPSEEDEDSMVGDFLGNLRTRTHRTKIGEQEYEWRILYKKFRGKGKGAYEKIIGADAIITFEISDISRGVKTLKSLIFQAKKGNNIAGLSDQKEKMSKVAVDGNFTLICTPDGYFAEQSESRKRVGDFLADDFLACRTGIEGMSFDPIKRELRFEKQNFIGIELNHRLTIDVKRHDTPKNNISRAF